MCQIRRSSDCQLRQCKEAGAGRQNSFKLTIVLSETLSFAQPSIFFLANQQSSIISSNESVEHFCHITSFTACLMYSMQDWAHIVAVQLCRSQLVTLNTEQLRFTVLHSTDTTTAACCLYSQSAAETHETQLITSDRGENKHRADQAV